jgi:hypothetical protein
MLVLGLALTLLAGPAQAAPDIAYGVLESPGKAIPSGARMIARSGTEWTRVADCDVPSATVEAQLPVISNPGCKLDGPGTMPIDRKLARMQHLRRWFSWVFIDHAHNRGEETLQALVEGLIEQGWRVATNDNPAPTERHRFPLARGQWAHFAHAGIFNGTPNREIRRTLRRHPRRIVNRNDRRFIRRVHRLDPGSLAVLKLEIHRDTDQLRRMPQDLQRKIIRALARYQRRFGYRFVFPIRVAADVRDRLGCLHPGQCMGYDARAEGTYRLQRRLMR